MRSQTLPHQNQPPPTKMTSPSLLLLVPLNTAIEVVNVVPPVPFGGPLNSPSQARERSTGLRFGSRRGRGRRLRLVSRHRKADGRLLSRRSGSRSRGRSGRGNWSGRSRRGRWEVGLLSSRRGSLLSRRGLPQPLSDLAARLTLVRAVGD